MEVIRNPSEVIMPFTLNQEEKNILNVIYDSTGGNDSVEYYTLTDSLHIEGDTSALIPVVSRLEDDGYITSSGLIFRYIRITDKGRREIGKT